MEKVVLFGDSLMAGYGLPAEQHLSVVLQDSLQKDGYKIQIINGSVSGSTSSAGLGRAEWTLAEPNIDLMILGLGANDMLRGIKPEETKKNLEGIINIAQTKDIKVMIAGMIAPSSHGADYKKVTRQDLADAADKYKNWGKWGPDDEIGTLNVVLMPK